MEQILEIMINVLELGLIYSLVGLSVYFSTHILKIDDFTIEDSFPLGGALTVVLLHANSNPFLCLVVAALAGALAGCVTGLVHTYLRLNILISSIVVTTMLFSINLKLTGPHASITSTNTIFDCLTLDVFERHNLMHLAVLAPLCLIMFMLAQWFLDSEVGFSLRATGSNASVLTYLGKNVGYYKIGGLMITNGLAAYAGSLFVQHTGFFSITGSLGTMIIALAGIILGKIMIHKRWASILVGSVLYQLIIALAIELQVDPVWNKLITGMLIVALISIRRRDQTRESKTLYSEDDL